MGVQTELYGVTKEGEQVRKFTVENQNSMRVVLIEYGAIVSELHVPDKEGKLRDVVWGYENLSGYEAGNPAGFGSTIGRNANRIGGAEVTIAGKVYELQKNNNGNNLHGGFPGYHQRMWRGEIAGENEVRFTLFSPDGDQGFPGNLHAAVTYQLTEENELRISYEATTDQDTVINMTNHSYFNLDGQESDSVLDQQVWLAASAFTPTDDELIPTGEIRSVEGTPLDFRTFCALGARIDEDYEPLRQGAGYDHNFVLDSKGGYALCAKMRSEKSGILMEIFTDAPGLQMYTGNFLESEPGQKNGRGYISRSAVAFETQYFPDALHHDNFPSTLLKAGDTCRTTTGYRFSNKQGG